MFITCIVSLGDSSNETGISHILVDIEDENKLPCNPENTMLVCSPVKVNSYWKVNL